MCKGIFYLPLSWSCNFQQLKKEIDKYGELEGLYCFGQKETRNVFQMAISHVVSGPVSTGSFLWGVAIYTLYPLQYERFDERRPNDVLACVIGFVKYESRCWIFF